MELRVSCVNLGFENLSVRTKEGGENIEGLSQDMSSIEEAGQGEGSSSTRN